jgi:hypothetical protein
MNKNLVHVICFFLRFLAACASANPHELTDRLFLRRSQFDRLLRIQLLQVWNKLGFLMQSEEIIHGGDSVLLVLLPQGAIDAEQRQHAGIAIIAFDAGIELRLNVAGRIGGQEQQTARIVPIQSDPTQFLFTEDDGSVRGLLRVQQNQPRPIVGQLVQRIVQKQRASLSKHLVRDLWPFAVLLAGTNGSAQGQKQQGQKNCSVVIH